PRASSKHQLATQSGSVTDVVDRGGHGPVSLGEVRTRNLSQMRDTRYDLRDTRYDLRWTMYRGVIVHEIRGTIYDVRCTAGLSSTRYEVRSTMYRGVIVHRISYLVNRKSYLVDRCLSPLRARDSPMTVRLTVYPDECDAFGHLNQASYLALFERARWELLSRGPGMDVFERAGVWPAVRRATIDYHSGVWPGDVLEFSTELVSRGRTSFTLRQRAVRRHDQRLAATLESVFVCIDTEERPVALPDAVLAALASEARRVTLPSGAVIGFDEAGQGDPPVVL